MVVLYKSHRGGGRALLTLVPDGVNTILSDLTTCFVVFWPVQLQYSVYAAAFPVYRSICV